MAPPDTVVADQSAGMRENKDQIYMTLKEVSHTIAATKREPSLKWFEKILIRRHFASSVALDNKGKELIGALSKAKRPIGLAISVIWRST